MAQPEIPGNGIGIPVMPYGSDGSNWLAFLVDALGRLQIDAEVGNFPADPATQTTLAATLTALQSIQNLVGALNDVGLDELRVRSSHGDKIFGFDSIVEDEKLNNNLQTGSEFIDGTPVGSGKVWKITQAVIRYDGTSSTFINLAVGGLANSLQLLLQTSPVSGRWYSWSGEVYLQVGDYLRAYAEGFTAGDDLYLRYAGVQMNAP